MGIVLMWFLIVSDGHSALSIGKFVTQNECEETRIQVEKKTKDKSGMVSMSAVCVSARVFP